jgi:dihydroxy-acid dehydratase
MSAPCADCTCGRAQVNEHVNEHGEPIGVRPSREERSFTAPTDYVEPTEGVEPAIPLRSKTWFNNPQDGE